MTDSQIEAEAEKRYPEPSKGVWTRILKKQQCFIDGARFHRDNQWISVDDELPKENQYVIVATKDGVCIATAEYIHEEKRWFMYGNYYTISTDVTHWMPLPDLPKTK